MVWAVVAVVLVVVVVSGALLASARRTRQLQRRFGPEYGRTVAEVGEQHAAEEELLRRTKRRERLAIVPLSERDQRVFSQRWKATQARFVDDPATAVEEADRLIGDVMVVRGYPVENFEQQAADVSVDHPDVVAEYRAGHRLAEVNGRQQASTEDLRQAMVHYRALFERLVTATDQPSEVPEKSLQARQPEVTP
jgi:hypothetical protein